VWLVLWLAQYGIAQTLLFFFQIGSSQAEVEIAQFNSTRILRANLSHNCYIMAAVYKALSKSDRKDEPKTNGALRENRQRVLILSSRGVTFRLDV
jgi:hypothetical protein